MNRFEEALESFGNTRARMTAQHSLTRLASARLAESEIYRYEALAAVERGEFLVVAAGTFDGWQSRLADRFRSWVCIQTAPVALAADREVVQVVVVLRADGSRSLTQAAREVRAARMAEAMVAKADSDGIRKGN